MEDLGLLWCSSCFYFEDFIGELRRLFRGTQSIETKVAFAVCVNQMVQKMSGRPLEENDENKIHKGSDRLNISVVGAYYSGRLTQTAVFAPHNVEQWEIVSFFHRVCVGTDPFQTMQNNKTEHQNHKI